MPKISWISTTTPAGECGALARNASNVPAPSVAVILMLSIRGPLLLPREVSRRDTSVMPAPNPLPAEEGLQVRAG